MVFELLLLSLLSFTLYFLFDNLTVGSVYAFRCRVVGHFSKTDNNNPGGRPCRKKISSLSTNDLALQRSRQLKSPRPLGWGEER